VTFDRLAAAPTSELQTPGHRNRVDFRLGARRLKRQRMHVQDGYLSPEVCAATGLVAAAAVGYSIYKLRDGVSDRVVPLTGMTAAMIFAGQMVNFPIGLPVSGHLIGGVLAGMILGPWAGCLAVTMVLVVQRFLFSDGGLFTLGANILHMAVIGSIGGYAIVSLVRRFFKKPNVGAIVGSVVASWVTVVAARSLIWIQAATATRAATTRSGSLCVTPLAIRTRRCRRLRRRGAHGTTWLASVTSQTPW